MSKKKVAGRKDISRVYSKSVNEFQDGIVGRTEKYKQILLLYISKNRKEAIGL